MERDRLLHFFYTLLAIFIDEKQLDCAYLSRYFFEKQDKRNRQNRIINGIGKVTIIVSFCENIVLMV
jgi:hypothetical protein